MMTERTNKTNRIITSMASKIAAITAALVLFSFNCVSVGAFSDLSEIDDDSTTLYIAGVEVDGSNTSGAGWSNDEATNTLTLNEYIYEGTCTFEVAEESDDEYDDDADESGEGEEGEEEEYEDEEEYDDEEDENINYGKGAGHMLSREQCLQIIIPVIPFTNER